MASPGLFSECISHNIIPQKYRELASQKITEDDNIEKLMQRYYPIFRGFEQFDMRRFLSGEIKYNPYIKKFETALQDFWTCVNCDGNGCKCSHFVTGGTPIYFALDYFGFKMYQGKYPAFHLVRCPGVTERKKEIVDLLQYKTNQEAG